MAAIKPSSWTAKRTGTLNKFYTRPEVGALLVREIGPICPETMIDLGAGEGSLAAAAVSEWPGVRITTVDIDATCIDDLHAKLVAAGARSHDHRLQDAFDPKLPDQLGRGSFDLAVCNPPFYRPEWQRGFADILQEAGFADACPTISEVSAEIIFLAQNLRLLKAGGTIALIVPDGLATGWRAIAFRRTLLQHHNLRAVVQLPPYSFVDTEAFCFILIIEKDCPEKSNGVRLTQLQENGTVSKPLLVSNKAAEIRLDYAYHFLAQDAGADSVTLRQLGAQIQRGSLSTVDRKKLEAFVFHTGDFPNDTGNVHFGSILPDIGAKRLIVAEAGDILMARVDRDLHEKIVFVSEGKAAITDCVYRIRLPEPYREVAFKALSSLNGRARIKATTKGVGARLIGKGELLDLPLQITVNAA